MVTNKDGSNNILLLATSALDMGTLSFSDWGKGRVTRELERFISSLALGVQTGNLDVQLNPTYGQGILLIASGSGAVGGTIGGKLVTATWATSDINSAGLVAAAINADVVANKFVSAAATTATGTLTIATGGGLTTCTVGPGTAIPFGPPPVSVSVTWATSDTATAAALALAINQNTSMPVIASSAAGVVTLYARAAGAGGNSYTLVGAGTGVTVSGALLTGGATNANVLITALVPGTIGLGVTLVASGTGVTAPSGANLVGANGAPGNSFAC